MNNKRERDELCYDKLVCNTKLRLEDDGSSLVDDDIVFETVDLTNGVKTILSYDSVLNEFVVVIERITPSATRSIGLNETAIDGLPWLLNWLIGTRNERLANPSIYRSNLSLPTLMKTNHYPFYSSSIICINKGNYNKTFGDVAKTKMVDIYILKPVYGYR